MIQITSRPATSRSASSIGDGSPGWSAGSAHSGPASGVYPSPGGAGRGLVLSGASLRPCREPDGILHPDRRKRRPPQVRQQLGGLLSRAVAP